MGSGGKAQLKCPQVSTAGKKNIMSQLEAHPPPCNPQGGKESLGPVGEVPISLTAQTLLCVLKTWVPSLTLLQLAI